MRILSRKKLEFRTDDKGSTITVEPLVFSEAPESIKNDPLFGWALSDGSIEVIETVAQQKKLENEPLAPTAPENEKTSIVPETGSVIPEIEPIVPENTDKTSKKK
jgi:hypothetical protein